ncbi:hypothetical protein VSDG_04262 [Cytospora chrysosperma]|uniref:Membrane anchor Opy2 N-terminal domain-containing protein n=1 Tax=Cytospora chrysosperma TaxID=252740 RepID=A0A423W5F7_CYTCH|nr:hypothetical protein VSDG_04262 [Valsa sordida]
MSYVEGKVFNAGLFPRQNGCVVCQDGSPTCPSCDDDEECLVSVPLDCTQCPQAYCAASSKTVSGGTSKPSSKASAGAIAGAVIGGLALVAIVGVVTYFVWKHCVKNKRAQMEQAAWDDDGEYGGQREKDFNTTRDARQSGQVRNSIASTVLTRASNIIQIAYIPGVTNRATPTSPTLLVPPVPPIPISVSSPAGTPTSTGDQHFFVPGDLRDSMASGMTGYTDRTSYARTSYAPRSSVASTIYGKAGVIVTPAQTGMRAKAAMVSVKSNVSGGSGESSVPPVPVVDKRRFQDQDQLSPTGSTFSVGSTFLNNATNANTATAVRAQVVRVGSTLKQATLASDRSTNEEDAERSGPSTPNTLQHSRDEQNSPFRDPPAERTRRESSHSLNAALDEPKRRSSHTPSIARTVSPFGDEHATS